MAELTEQRIDTLDRRVADLEHNQARMTVAMERMMVTSENLVHRSEIHDEMLLSQNAAVAYDRGFAAARWATMAAIGVAMLSLIGAIIVTFAPGIFGVAASGR